MKPTLIIEISQAQQEQKYQLVKFLGEFDKAGHSQIRESLDNCVKNFVLKFLVFDFTSLDFINSEGIGYLMEIHTHLLHQDGQFVIVGPKNHVMDVFETIGLTEIIPVYQTLDEFIKTLK